MTLMLSSFRSISIFGISSESFPKSFFFFFWNIVNGGQFSHFISGRRKKEDNDYSEPSVVRRVSNRAVECCSG